MIIEEGLEEEKMMPSKTNVALKAMSGRIGLDGWTSGQGYA